MACCVRSVALRSPGAGFATPASAFSSSRWSDIFAKIYCINLDDRCHGMGCFRKWLMNGELMVD